MVRRDFQHLKSDATKSKKAEAQLCEEGFIAARWLVLPLYSRLARFLWRIAWKSDWDDETTMRSMFLFSNMDS
jgi:hypothetical protein